jgi:hypothetical protein
MRFANHKEKLKNNEILNNEFVIFRCFSTFFYDFPFTYDSHQVGMLSGASQKISGINYDCPKKKLHEILHVSTCSLHENTRVYIKVSCTYSVICPYSYMYLHEQT